MDIDHWLIARSMRASERSRSRGSGGEKEIPAGEGTHILEIVEVVKLITTKHLSATGFIWQ
jgi:hypothetical protein